MAHLRASLEFVADRLFGFSPNPVAIKDARLSEDGTYIEIEIEGADVPPNAAQVSALFRVSTNRAGEKFHTLTFQPDSAASSPETSDDR